MNQYKPGDKVEANGNKEAIIQELYHITNEGLELYNVRLWDGMRHIGDVCMGSNELVLIERV